MDLNLLAIFAAVAEARGFSAAADRLKVPKSSVSRAVARLEKQMGVRLIHRTTRQVSLSTAGAALFERVQPLLAALREAAGDLPELEAEPSGDLKVSAPVDMGVEVLAEVAARFAARYPGVRLDLRLENRLVDLVAEGYDAALRMTGRLRDSSLVARKLGQVRMALYAAPTYLARHGAPRTPRDLAGHRWVVFRAPGPLRLVGPEGTARVVVEGRVACDDMLGLRELARHGAGIALLPAALAEGMVAAGQLAPVLPRWSADGGGIWLVFPGARHLPRKVAAFRDFVMEALRARPAFSAE